MKRRRPDMHGFSEEELKKRLERHGWTVWKGGLIGITRRKELYPNVERKYSRLKELLLRDFPEFVEELEYINAVHHGMPDYICFRNWNHKKEWKFVECKLMHEQLSARQKICIRKLQAMGFAVEVQKLVDHRTKMRHAEVDLENKLKRIRERQTTLKGRGKVKMI
jgi:hypothetical protein